jgi:acetoin utilization deacetylase AcuC-like enzyme
MVLASNGGAVSAALTALKDGVAGSLSSGLHHARRASGAGFCTFNGLAIAAKAVLAAGSRSVLILDLDAHFGGGTASLINDESTIRQVDVSVSSYDDYIATEQTRAELVTNPSEYIPTIRKVLADAERTEFDLCIYNAGMDPCDSWTSGVKHGVSKEMLAERERIVFDWCRKRGLPVAFVLAGGYTGSRLDEAGLVNLHRFTLEAAGGD